MADSVFVEPYWSVRKLVKSGKIGEVVQVYVTDKEASVDRPLKELKGFVKVALQPGEEKKVTIGLSERDFAFYNVEKKDFVAEAGEFEILVGASAEDIRLKETIEI